MNTPILAEPLNEAEKRMIFTNIYSDYTEETVLDHYIDAFISKNKLKGYETKDIIKRKLIVAVVLALAVFLEIVYMALYHTLTPMIFALIEIILYTAFFTNQTLKKYLVREVVRRPDDNIDNILISQVSGATKGPIGIIISVIPLAVVFVVSIIIFMTPHMIFEENSAGGYSLRYYTKSIVSENEVVIPDTYNGLPVTEIRGGVFSNMGNIEYIALPSGLTEIRGNTFEYCDALVRIDIPEGVTRIGGHAFYGCSSLEEVTVPYTVASIGSSAFRQCDSLYYISIPADAEVNARAFKESPTEVSYY